MAVGKYFDYFSPGLDRFPATSTGQNVVEAKASKFHPPWTEVDTQGLFLELAVRKIKMEIQNEDFN